MSVVVVVISDAAVESPPFDLADVLTVLEPRLQESQWTVRDVECLGDQAPSMHAVSDGEALVFGADLIRMARGLTQTIDGQFFATVDGKPWVFITAVDGSGFDVVTEDGSIVDGLLRRFPGARVMTGAEYGIQDIGDTRP